MKVSFFLILFFLFNILFSKAVVVNPGKPLNPEAGKVIKLKKVYEISGEAEDYVLIKPYKLDLAANGVMLISDHKQLLLFTPAGKFIKNLYKKGQGPGEMHRRIYAAISGDRIYIHVPILRKLIISDLNGKLLKEKKVEMHELVGKIGERFLFRRSNLSDLRSEYLRKRRRNTGGSTFYALKNTFLFYSLSTGEEKIVGEFPSKHLLSNSVTPMERMKFRLYKDKLLLTHTGEYLVKIVDLKNGGIKQFSRQYKRVENTSPSKNRRKYIQDIKSLHVFKKHIWVKTSTEDPEKGYLFDVFDFDGRYIDAFYLGSKGYISKIDGDFIYLTRKDEDYNFYIVKYKVLDYHKSAK